MYLWLIIISEAVPGRGRLAQGGEAALQPHCGGCGSRSSPGTARSSRQAQPPAGHGSALFALPVNPRQGCARVSLWLWLKEVTRFGAFLQENLPLFNGNACLLEFSCVAARGRECHNLRWKPWDTKQVHTPRGFQRQGVAAQAVVSILQAENGVTCADHKSCKVPFQRDEIAGAL